MLANIIFQFFSKGGPVMWPILISALVAVAVVGERAFWWWRESRRRDPHTMEQLLAAPRKCGRARRHKNRRGFGRSRHPHGLSRIKSRAYFAAPVGALQLAAGIELKRAPGGFSPSWTRSSLWRRCLGLLGTVTGLMRAFLNIGSAELSVSAVTGGIGEALIATACGLGIAIFALIPFNFFSRQIDPITVRP